MTNNTLGEQQTYAAVWIEVRCADKTDLQGFSPNGCFSNAAYATKPGRGGNLTFESDFPAAKAHK